MFYTNQKLKNQKIENQNFIYNFLFQFIKNNKMAI